MALKLSKRAEGDVTVVEAVGRIVLGEETNILREQVKAMLASGSKKIVLNLAQVDFIDSSGLGALVGLHSTAQAQGAKIRLANITKRFHELLLITKLLTVFDVYPSEPEAVRSFA